MSIFDLVYEGFSNHQHTTLTNLRTRWCFLDPSIVHPDSLVKELKAFCDCLGLETHKDFCIAINPNVGLIDKDMSKLISNFINSIQSSLGSNNSMDTVYASLFAPKPKQDRY